MKKSVVIIGGGNVADALTRALCRVGNPPALVYARKREAAAEIASICGCPFTDDAGDVATAAADLLLVTVSDGAIKQVIRDLGIGRRGAVVAHTAGSVGLDVFPDDVPNRAVFYPLQTFTKGREVDFGNVPILIEANNHIAESVAREVGELLSRKVVYASTPDRTLLHMAAVFTCNFTNYMYTVGEQLSEEAGFDFSLLKPLVLETARKAVEADSPRNVQTGPAVRNDFRTKSLHTEMLGQKPYLKNIYINISNSIWETLKKI